MQYLIVDQFLSNTVIKLNDIFVASLKTFD